MLVKEEGVYMEKNKKRKKNKNCFVIVMYSVFYVDKILYVF